ncbi:MAG: cytochrome-c peroxidase [Hyphomicrobiaceae bacterium]
MRPAWLPPRSPIGWAPRTLAAGAAALGLLLWLAASMTSAPKALGQVAQDQAVRDGSEPITIVRPPEPGDPAKVSLGKRLFHDARLSGDGTAACTSCHDLNAGGDDDRDHSIGADGKPLAFNAPTIFNVSRNFRLNWRGEFRSIEEQNEAALLDPAVMNTNWSDLLSKLQSDPGYVRSFDSAYGSSPTRTSVLDALAAFQRSLVTVDARFDRYLRGERNALTAEELRGYELFKRYGCVACHQGANVGGNLFQKFGIFADPFAQRGRDDDSDLGRFIVTGLERDRHVFRVPSLRNVALTAPYFHDGRTGSLEDAIRIMARTQLGRELSEPDVDAIRRFLDTLTGEYQGHPFGKVPER